MYNQAPILSDQNQGYQATNEKKKEEEPKLILIPWEDKNTFVFQLKVGTLTLSRRIDNHTVNGTKLLNIGGLTRGRRDGILKNEKERNVIKHGPLNLKGVWIPLSRARLITEKHKITPEINIILEDDPSKYLDEDSQMELKGKYEPYMRVKDRYADDDYISNKYSGVINNCYQNPMSSNQKFHPYIAQYINNNSLKHNNMTELPTENIGTSSNDINHPMAQNPNYMNPCNLEYIIHTPEKNFVYNEDESSYFNQPQNEGFQQEYNLQVQYSNINKSIKKNSQSTQRPLNQFSPIPPIHSQLQSNSYNSYTNIYDNSNVNSIQYNNQLSKQIQNTSYNNLSNYSSNPNPSLIYPNYTNWIDNNDIASINNTNYNGNNSKYNDERITQINNADYNGFTSNNINY